MLCGAGGRAGRERAGEIATGLYVTRMFAKRNTVRDQPDAQCFARVPEIAHPDLTFRNYRALYPIEAICQCPSAHAHADDTNETGQTHCVVRRC